MKLSQAGIALLLAVGSANSTATETETPTGGWRVSASQSADHMQAVHYPVVHANAEGADPGSLIAGRIATTAKPGSTAIPLLIVNGTPLPLPARDGVYARPYAFGSGANGIEVRDANGDVVRRTQFFEGNANKTPARLRVVLAWDTDHTDVDLHVVAPNGEHTWYGERVSASGGALDVDVTDGYGPEIFASTAPLPGTWLVFTNYYGGDDSADITLAQVTVIQHENTAREKRETFSVPLRNPGELNAVARFVFQADAP